MVNALYDVGFNTTKGKKLSYTRLKENIHFCIKMKSLREMNIKLLLKFKDSPYMNNNQLKLINNTLNKLQKIQSKDNDNKNEDIKEKENKEGAQNILVK